MKFVRLAVAITMTLVLAFIFSFCIVGCSRSSSSTSIDEPPKSESSQSADYNETSEPDTPNYSIPETPRYEDPRWPTTYQELLSVPESERWYNARNHVGTTCTIVGPVAEVYQAADSTGRPIFVDIGEAYPSPDRVTLVVWEDQWKDFSRMLSEVDLEDNSWLSVTGYLSQYDGAAQFDINDGPVSYSWWTNVG